jgi:hypothetical protein
MPQIPKPANQRQRRNRSAGARQLTVVHDVKMPELPSGEDSGWEWHPMTVAWWKDTWTSPMAPEYDDSDKHGLFMLAVLVDQYWVQPTTALAAEIRLQRQCFGLTPIDRRRLQWEIDRGDQAQRSTQQRQNEAAPKAAASTASKAADPRAMLS